MNAHRLQETGARQSLSRGMVRPCARIGAGTLRTAAASRSRPTAPPATRPTDATRKQSATTRRVETSSEMRLRVDWYARHALPVGADVQLLWSAEPGTRAASQQPAICAVIVTLCVSTTTRAKAATSRRLDTRRAARQRAPRAHHLHLTCEGGHIRL